MNGSSKENTAIALGDAELNTLLSRELGKKD